MTTSEDSSSASGTELPDCSIVSSFEGVASVDGLFDISSVVSDFPSSPVVVDSGTSETSVVDSDPTCTAGSSPCGFSESELDDSEFPFSVETSVFCEFVSSLLLSITEGDDSDLPDSFVASADGVVEVSDVTSGVFCSASSVSVSSTEVLSALPASLAVGFSTAGAGATSVSFASASFPSAPVVVASGVSAFGSVTFASGDSVGSDVDGLFSPVASPSGASSATFGASGVSFASVDSSETVVSTVDDSSE